MTCVFLFIESVMAVTGFKNLVVRVVMNKLVFLMNKVHRSIFSNVKT